MIPSKGTPARRARLERIALLSAAVAAGTLLSPQLVHAAGAVPAAALAAVSECQPWNASTAYASGDTATEGGVTYQAGFWTQGDDPATHSGAAGSGQPWTVAGTCASTPPPPPPVPPSAPAPCDPWNTSVAYKKGALVTEAGVGYAALVKSTGKDPATNHGTKANGADWKISRKCAVKPPPAGHLVFGSYKDITASMNWNTDEIDTAVMGSSQPAVSVIPAKQETLLWSFATGECGSEGWAGVPSAQLVATNVHAWVAAGKKYIISTGGANGAFTCGSDAGFEKFLATYDSTSLQGIDFDIEGGQTQDVIDNLVTRVKTAQARHPNLRFSFTLATFGGNLPQSLGSYGVMTMNAIKAANLSNYYVNLMTMDYGPANAADCTLGASGLCDMGQSAINAAVNLHDNYGVPYAQIELTPMTGQNDTFDEVFSLANVDTVSAWALKNGLGGVHFWSLDRDPGLTYTNRFISALGL